MKPIHWLRFYRKPLTSIGAIAMFSLLAVININLLFTEGLDFWRYGIDFLFLGINVLGVTVYSLNLYKWRRQFLQWKLQSFQRGGSHSSLSSEDLKKYKEEFER